MNGLKYALMFAVATAGAQWLHADPTTPPNPDVQRVLDQQSGRQQLDPTNAADVYSRLTDIVNSATTKDGFNNLIGSFAKADRDRLSADKIDLTTLNTSIGQFRTDFRNRYNTEFDLSRIQFSGVRVYQGKDSDHAYVLITNLIAAQNVDWRKTHSSAANDAANNINNGAPNANSPLHNSSTADDTSKMNNDSDNPGNRNAPAVGVRSPDNANTNNTANATPTNNQSNLNQTNTAAANGTRVDTGAPSQGTNAPNTGTTGLADASANHPAGPKGDTTSTPSGVANSNTQVNTPSGNSTPPNPAALAKTDTNETNTNNTNTNNTNNTNNTMNANTANNSSSINGQYTADSNKLCLTHETMLGNAWRLNVPNTMTAQNLSDSLSHSLQQLSANQSSWPADVNTAYRVIETNVLQSINNAGNASNVTVENR